MKIILKREKPRDYIGKDLRSPKFRMRIVGDKRKKEPKYSKEYIDNVY